MTGEINVLNDVSCQDRSVFVFNYLGGISDGISEFVFSHGHLDNISGSQYHFGSPSSISSCVSKLGNLVMLCI